MVTPPHIVPEWYLLPYYAILRSITFSIFGIPAKLLGVIFSLGSIILLFLVPWLDTSPVRSARFRPVYRLVSWLLPIHVIALGYVGSQPPEGWVVTLGQSCTFYYYFHFLILMPVLGKIERPRPLPISIAAAVLNPDRVRRQPVRRKGADMARASRVASIAALALLAVLGGARAADEATAADTRAAASAMVV